MCLLIRVVCVAVRTGRILAMSNKHLYNAVYSLVCRAELLLTWCQQVNSNCQESADELQTSLNTLLKVFNCYIFNYICSSGLLMHTGSVSSHRVMTQFKTTAS